MNEVTEVAVNSAIKTLQIKNLEDIKNLRVNLESKILNSKNVIIVPHIGIDFDAFASAIRRFIYIN